jgi:hypothetical protein
MNFEANAVSITVFCALFLLVTVLGFVAARWKRGDLDLLDEWGLGGLLAGWAVGMVVGTWIAASQDYTPVWDTPIVGATVYTGLVALAVNLVVAGALTLVLGGRGRADELDETRDVDYDELLETREPAPTVGAGVA